MNPVYARLGTTIFEATSRRAAAIGAINLGQGFPDGPRPDAVLAAAADALLNGSNQYPPMAGLPELRSAVVDFYRRRQGLDLTAEEVTVTSGATEALAAAILALVTPGDEVIVFQPLYDAYIPLIERAGGIVKPLRLEPPDWRVDADALEAAIGPRTRLLVINDPLNPTGSCASAADLAVIADACIRHDLIAICDEVWEATILDGEPHRSLIGLPGMRERTVKIGSAGKIFALTGWKVGWMCAAPPLTQVLARAHQFLTFTTPPNLQTAVAFGLNTQEQWIAGAAAQYRASRDRLVAGLAANGLVTLPASASYFVLIDLIASGIAPDDHAFCERLIEAAGVAAIPVSAFYAEQPVRHLVRLCFAKQDDVIDAALERISKAMASGSLT